MLITNIQFLRAFAALGVVIYHTGFLYRGSVHTELQGVAIFFVISGFIMTHISRKGHEGFLLQRLIRIVPLYWLVTLAIFFMKLKARGAGPDLTLGALGKSLLFIPYRDSTGEWLPIDGVGWTLNFEMYFYLVFAIALAASVRFAPFIAAAAVLAIRPLAALTSNEIFAFYAHDYIIYFTLGIAAFYLWRGIAPRLQGRGAAVTLASIASAVAFLAWHLFPELVAACPPRIAALIDHLMPLIVVFAALCLNSIGLQSNWKPVLVLGDASYALYLIHTQIIGQLRRMGHAIDAQSGVGTVLFVMAVSCTCAVALHYIFERPVTRRLRSLMRLPRDGKPGDAAVTRSPA